MHQIVTPTDNDIESANRLLWTAFSVTGGMFDVKAWGFNQPPETWSYVIRDGGEVVSHFSFYTHFDNNIRGARLPFAGVWGVTTTPTHRRRGMLRALFGAAFKKMKAEGMVLSILDPSFVQIYERFGYANAEQYMRHIFTPDQIRQLPVPDGIAMHEIRDAAELSKVDNLQKTMARLGSRVFMETGRLKENLDHRYLIERSGEPVGTVKFDFKGESYFRSDVHVTISRAMFDTEDVLPSVVQLIRGFSDQCKQFTWESDVQVPVQHFLYERGRMNSELCGTMMLRVVDFEGFCSQIRTSADREASLVMALEDIDCPWNSGLYQLLPSGGELRTQRLEEGEMEPDIALTALQLSRVVSGLTPATLLHGLGELNCTRETAEKLESIFPADNFYAYQRF
jgi:predicted acetyltransferase